jgi:hypothetical protein
MKEEMCLVDSCTTNSILRKTKYFQTLTRRTKNILTIAEHNTNIVGSVRATIILPISVQVTIENALLYHNSTRTLLSYKYIYKNGFHVITHEENNEEFLHIIKKNGDGHDILERMSSLPSRLYYTYIKLVPHVAYKEFFQNVDIFVTWHERLGHPRLGMMRKILGNSICHNLNAAKFPKSSDFMCTTCATEKLILRPSPLKIQVEPLKFLQRI